MRKFNIKVFLFGAAYIKRFDSNHDRANDNDFINLANAFAMWLYTSLIYLIIDHVYNDI